MGRISVAVIVALASPATAQTVDTLIGTLGDDYVDVTPEQAVTDGLPAQGGESGMCLTTDGAALDWGACGSGTPLSNTAPLADGTAAAGSATDASRGDHVHPAGAAELPALAGKTGHVLAVNSGASGVFWDQAADAVARGLPTQSAATEGQCLTSNGASSPPEWAACGTGGGGTGSARVTAFFDRVALSNPALPSQRLTPASGLDWTLFPTKSYTSGLDPAPFFTAFDGFMTLTFQQAEVFTITLTIGHEFAGGTPDIVSTRAISYRATAGAQFTVPWNDFSSVTDLRGQSTAALADTVNITIEASLTVETNANMTAITNSAAVSFWQPADKAEAAPDLSNSTPHATASGGSAGTAVKASRSDHVHATELVASYPIAALPATIDADDVIAWGQSTAAGKPNRSMHYDQFVRSVFDDIDTLLDITASSVADADGMAISNADGTEGSKGWEISIGEMKKIFAPLPTQSSATTLANLQSTGVADAAPVWGHSLATRSRDAGAGKIIVTQAAAPYYKFDEESKAVLEGLPATTGHAGKVLTVTSDAAGIEWAAGGGGGGGGSAGAGWTTIIEDWSPGNNTRTFTPTGTAATACRDADFLVAITPKAVPYYGILPRRPTANATAGNLTDYPEVMYWQHNSDGSDRAYAGINALIFGCPESISGDTSVYAITARGNIQVGAKISIYAYRGGGGGDSGPSVPAPSMASAGAFLAVEDTGGYKLIVPNDAQFGPGTGAFAFPVVDDDDEHGFLSPDYILQYAATRSVGNPDFSKPGFIALNTDTATRANQPFVLDNRPADNSRALMMLTESVGTNSGWIEQIRTPTQTPQDTHTLEDGQVWQASGCETTDGTLTCAGGFGRAPHGRYKLGAGFNATTNGSGNIVSHTLPDATYNAIRAEVTAMGSGAWTYWATFRSTAELSTNTIRWNRCEFVGLGPDYVESAKTVGLPGTCAVAGTSGTTIPNSNVTAAWLTIGPSSGTLRADSLHGSTEYTVELWGEG